MLQYIRKTFMIDYVFFSLYVIDYSDSESTLQFVVKAHIFSDLAYL